jgi:hypothetical protein
MVKREKCPFLAPHLSRNIAVIIVLISTKHKVFLIIQIKQSTLQNFANHAVYYCLSFIDNLFTAVIFDGKSEISKFA